MSDYPEVPTERLSAGGWERRTESETTVFRTPTASVRGHTRVYEDAALREALERAGAVDLLADPGDGASGSLVDAAGGVWRFFFVTGLTFTPPLAPGIGPASMLPTVTSEARRSFADDLAARGFVDVDRGRSQRMRTDAGDRVRLSKFTARLPLDDGTDLAVEGWLAVWVHDGEFRIAGGAYPTRGLEELLAGLDAGERPATDPGRYREELLALLRAVE